MCSSHEGTSNAESLALRRVFLQRVAFAAALFPSLVSAEAPIEVDAEKRGSQRGGALVEQDFPFFKGKYPPRVLVFEELPKQEGSKPIYNAWGACVQDSCSYVPLKQRYDGYKKYKDSTTRASSILQGALLQSATGSAFDVDEGKVFEKALRRGAARFYVNEAYFGMVQLQKEAGAGNTAAAKEWWLLCRDRSHPLPPTSRNPTQETAFSVQFVPGIRFLVTEFGEYAHPT
eukprot:1593070-Rhodomonas_salina.1